MDQAASKGERTLGVAGVALSRFVLFCFALGTFLVVTAIFFGEISAPNEVLLFGLWSIGVLIGIFQMRELAWIAITEPGLEVHRLFKVESIPWEDVLSITYDRWRFPQLVITTKATSQWFGPRAIRIPYNQPPNFSVDWRTGLKEMFGFFGSNVPDEIMELKERVAAAHAQAKIFS